MRHTVIVLLSISAASTCELTAKIISESIRPMWAQFTFHNESTSPVLEFASKGKNYTVVITGSPCNLMPTILTSYNKRPGPDVEPVGYSSAFLEGTGVLDYLIYETTPPKMGMRIGVTCGFGDCGGGG